MLCSVACNRNTECDSGKELNSIPPREIVVQIIKFKQPEHKDYILTHFSTRENCGLSPVMECISFPDLNVSPYRQSPYIELADDYLLLDWKSTIMWDTRAIINEKWTEWIDDNTCWNTENLYIEYPVAELYHIEQSKIKKYNNEYLENSEINSLAGFYFQKDWACLTNQQKDYLKKWFDNADNAYVEYTEILTRMISEGKLDEYGSSIELRNK